MHFGILWHFGIFAKKSNKKSNPIFPILSDFFRFLDFSRLLDLPIPQLYLVPFGKAHVTSRTQACNAGILLNKHINTGCLCKPENGSS